MDLWIEATWYTHVDLMCLSLLIENSLMQMSAVDKTEYIDILRSRASISVPNYVSKGITACPWGWYEAKVMDPSSPK